MTLDYRSQIKSELAVALEQREALEERIRALVEADAALARLERPDHAAGTEALNAAALDIRPAEHFKGRPDLSKVALPEAIVAALEFFGEELDLAQLAANVRLFGYPFRTSNYEASVSAALTGLVQSRRVARTGRGRYCLPKAPVDSADRLLDLHEDQILLALQNVQRTLPFVGLKYFRDRILPTVVDVPNEEDRRELMNALVSRGIVSKYEVPNPSNPEFPTSAIRVP